MALDSGLGDDSLDAMLVCLAGGERRKPAGYEAGLKQKDDRPSSTGYAPTPGIEERADREHGNDDGEGEGKVDD